MSTIQAAYQQFCKNLTNIHDSNEARSIARIVFEDAFGISNFERQDNFSSENQSRLKTIEKRLLGHEPIQYILGMADFYGLKFRVSPAVLIPRQETEELVYLVLESMKSLEKQSNLKILDIGTGSGCIPITIKKKSPTQEVEALDISNAALKIAKENALIHETEIRFFLMDILNKSNWEKLGKYDIIISNPPYIPYQEMTLMPEQVKAFEPGKALFVDNEEPLIFYQKIAAFAALKLNKGGLLFFECNEFNAKEVVEILERQSFENVSLEKDLYGKDRIVLGQIN